MKIRTWALVGTVVATLPCVAATLWMSRMEAVNWRVAEQALEGARVVSAVQRAQTALVLEAGELTTAARAATPDRNALTRTREAATGALNAAVAATRAAGLDPAPLTAAASQFDALRTRLDGILAKPPAERDPAFGTDVTNLRFRMAGQMTALASKEARRAGRASPEIAVLMTLAQHAMDIRDQIGGRNLLLNAVIGAASVAPETIVRLDRQTGRAEEAWANAERQVVIRSPRHSRRRATGSARSMSRAGRRRSRSPAPMSAIPASVPRRLGRRRWPNIASGACLRSPKCWRCVTRRWMRPCSPARAKPRQRCARSPRRSC
ncbi:MAG: hypothetical protein J0H99_20325 [Rhodospirillales bacterium]|nr:hypothetical protein [Rhodospirillales bacterium]